MEYYSQNGEQNIAVGLFSSDKDSIQAASCLACVYRRYKDPNQSSQAEYNFRNIIIGQILDVSYPPHHTQRAEDPFPTLSHSSSRLTPSSDESLLLIKGYA